MARGLYFLVTPVAPSILRQVNCLLLGAVTLPNTLLTGQVRRDDTSHTLSTLNTSPMYSLLHKPLFNIFV